MPSQPNQPSTVFSRLHKVVNFNRAPVKFLVSIIISFFVGWLAYVQSGSPEYRFELQAMKWYWIPFLSFLTILACFLRSWRLERFFHTQEFGFWKKIKTLFFSLSFSFLIGGIGLLIRILILKREIKIRPVVSLSYISLEKVLDLILAFVILFFLLTIPNSENPVIVWIHQNKMVIVMLFLISFVCGYFYQKKIFHGLLSVIYFLSSKVPFLKKYHYFFKRQFFYLHKSLISLSFKQILVFFLHSLGILLVESCFFYFALTFLGVEVRVEQALLINVTLILALLVPIFPSGIGLFQAVIVFILPDQNVFYTSILVHFFLIITYIVILSLGFYQFFDSIKSPLKKSLRKSLRL